MLSWTACGLLLPYGGLAVALAMDAVPRLTLLVFTLLVFTLLVSLLVLGAVPLLVTLLATHKTLVVVATVPLCFHTSGLSTLA